MGTAKGYNASRPVQDGSLRLKRFNFWNIFETSALCKNNQLFSNEKVS